MTNITLKQAKARVDRLQPVGASYFRKDTGVQATLRVVQFRSRRFDNAFQMRSINGDWSEWVAENRVQFTTG